MSIYTVKITFSKLCLHKLFKLFLCVDTYKTNSHLLHKKSTLLKIKSGFTLHTLSAMLLSVQELWSRPPCSFSRFFSSDQRNTEFCIVFHKSKTNKNKIFINGGNFSSLFFLYPVLQNIKCFLKPFFIV